MKLIDPAVWQALQAAGLRVLPVAADQLDLRLGSNGPDQDDNRSEGATDQQPTRVRVLARNRPLSPAELRALADRSPGPTLVVVPTATPAVRAAASRLGWSLIATNPRSSAGPEGVLRWPSGRTVSIGGAEPGRLPAAGPSRPGRVPWGGLTVVRRLAEGAAGTQTQLARLACVTQARVSQVLKDLNVAGLIGPGGAQPRSYRATDTERLLQHWLDNYPGPGGISTFWYGLDDPATQARAVIALLRRQRAPGGELPGLAAAVSGDVAADQVAPWRRPRLAAVYARRGADLTEIGLTPSTEQDATLELTVPRDPGVWPTSGSQDVVTWPGPPGLPLADPVQILWDVRRAPGPDRDQAAERLLTALTVAVGERGTPPTGGEPR
jgi:hypothetical protein